MRTLLYDIVPKAHKYLTLIIKPLENRNFYRCEQPYFIIKCLLKS